MQIYLSCDHAGFEHKNFVKKYLQDKGYFVKDFGAFELNNDDNFTDFIIPCSRELSNKFQGKAIDARGIIFGGSGNGEAMVANKFQGIRACVINCENIELVRLARAHNDANILSIGSRFVKKEFLVLAIDTFLKTEFEGGKYLKRNLQIDAL